LVPRERPDVPFPSGGVTPRLFDDVGGVLLLEPLGRERLRRSFHLDQWPNAVCVVLTVLTIDGLMGRDASLERRLRHLAAPASHPGALLGVGRLRGELLLGHALLALEVPDDGLATFRAKHLLHAGLGDPAGAKLGINPTKPAVPGTPERREFEYERSGTAVLYAALNVHQGDVYGWVTDTCDSINFITFLWDLIDQTPPDRELHCIVDNLSAHLTDKTNVLLEHNPRVHLHFTPTHASWLNQVELFFSILERRLLRRCDFGSVDQLARRIIAFINDYNRRAAPFRWTYEGRPLMAA
jgi:transposase